VSITIQLENLALCGPLETNINQGTWLNGFGTTFEVYDNGGGSYTIDQAILGLPCGKAGGGELFTLNVQGTIQNGTGTITVTDVIVRDCNNGPLAGIPGAPGMITIDTTPPAAVSDLAATQVKTGNPDTQQTTTILVDFTLQPTAGTVSVYRKGYGHYPEYDDCSGTGVPTAPATPAAAVAAGWTLTLLSAPHQTDFTTVRDFYYYVVFTADACGNISAVSNVTSPGRLNYHLGDVSDGFTLGHGNNRVSIEDITLLGAHYGIVISPTCDAAWNYLDVGPTSDTSVNGRPLTDNRVNFEDLIIFAINYETVHKNGTGFVSLGSSGIGPAGLDIGSLVRRARSGQVIEIPIALRGESRDVQGIHTVLSYDPAMFAYESSDVAPALAGTEHFFRGEPAGGSVELSLALLGNGAALSGEGAVLTVRLRALREGPVSARLSGTNLRDTENRELLTPADRIVKNAGEQVEAVAHPTACRLGDARPNPFNPKTTIAYELSEASNVQILIFDASGRIVRTLLNSSRPAGAHSVEWDGTDDGGRHVGSGIYFYTMRAGAWESQKRMTLLK